jgi:hypothetical protein
MPALDRTLYRGDYARRAALVRAQAYANPLTTCARCGLTLAEHPPTKTGKPPKWDAGHERDGDPTSPLRAEVARCNRAAGGQRRHAIHQPLRTTRDW